MREKGKQSSMCLFTPPVPFRENWQEAGAGAEPKIPDWCSDMWTLVLQAVL